MPKHFDEVKIWRLRVGFPPVESIVFHEVAGETAGMLRVITVISGRLPAQQITRIR